MKKQVKSDISHYNFFPKSRSGTDKIISVYWFVILFIVAAGVAYMVFLFYGEPYDVRNVEVNALTNSVANCFSSGGMLVDGWKEKSLDSCHLNFETEDFKNWREQEQYYVGVEFLNFENGAKMRDPIETGNKNLLDDCGKGKNFPACLTRSFYSVDNAGIQYEIKITSAVKKVEKNVR